MAEVRGHAAVEGVEIGFLHCTGPATFSHGEPLVQPGDQARPCRAKSFVDAAEVSLITRMFGRCTCSRCASPNAVLLESARQDHARRGAATLPRLLANAT